MEIHHYVIWSMAIALGVSLSGVFYQFRKEYLERKRKAEEDKYSHWL